jgi:hypothetical protein
VLPRQRLIRWFCFRNSTPDDVDIGLSQMIRLYNSRRRIEKARQLYQYLGRNWELHDKIVLDAVICGWACLTDSSAIYDDSGVSLMNDPHFRQ